MNGASWNGMSLADFSVARLIRLYPLYFLGSALGLFSASRFDHAYSRNHLTPSELLTTIALSSLLLPNLGEGLGESQRFPAEWSGMVAVF